MRPHCAGRAKNETSVALAPSTDGGINGIGIQPMNIIEKKYVDGTYLKNKPTWDFEDSLWKAQWVAEILDHNKICPNSICDVGCGSGGVIKFLRKSYPHSELFGFDISADASLFWQKHDSLNISFQVGDFIELNAKKYDVLLLLDVIEHLSDPYLFLTALRKHSSYCLFHFPLDLSAVNVLRETPILNSREKFGHINFFTKNLALSILKECGYHVIDWCYSGAAFTAPQRNLKTLLASFPRRIFYKMNKDFGVRLLGGETLFVLAQSEILA